MGKSRPVSLIILAILAAVFFAMDPAFAWYSYGKPGDLDIHRGLTLLSLDVVNSSIKFKDLNTQEKIVMLRQGANAPDKNKNPLDHEATFRIRDTLCASLKSPNSKEALMRLAIGFHYLADNGDATEGSYKGDLLKIANAMLYNINNWGFVNSQEWRQLAFDYDRRMKQITSVDSLVKNLRNMAKFQNNKLNSAYANRNYIMLKREFMVTFAYIRACQNRYLDFYNEEFTNGEKGECNFIVSVDNRSVNCSTTTKSGRDTPAIVNVMVGRNPGTAIFSYEMYTVKDRMIVTYGGQTLLDTGCVSGSKQIKLYLSGMSDQVIVYVKPACEKSGTEWNFKLECPR